MSNNLVEEIATKVAALPFEKQREALAFVESLAARQSGAGAQKQQFRSVKGILKADFGRLEEDIAEMRLESLKNFPREEPH